MEALRCSAGSSVGDWGLGFGVGRGELGCLAVMLVERGCLAVLKLAPKLDCFLRSLRTDGVVTCEAEARTVTCWPENLLFRGETSCRKEPCWPMRTAESEKELGLLPVFGVGTGWGLGCASPTVETLLTTLAMVRWLWILLGQQQLQRLELAHPRRGREVFDFEGQRRGRHRRRRLQVDRRLFFGLPVSPGLQEGVLQAVCGRGPAGRVAVEHEGEQVDGW